MKTPNIDEALERIKSLPTLPSVLGRILATVADPDASIVELTQHVESDPSLTATLLRLVNSAYYGHPREIDSIPRAIVMLGFTEVRNLTLAISTFRSMQQGRHDFDRLQLWKHSFAAAMAAERLAKLQGIGEEGSFVAGLLHDIGKVALDALFPASFLCAVHKAKMEGKLLRETEREIMGMDHAEVGALLGQRWDLPCAVVGAIRYHHALESAGEHARLASLAALADYVTYPAGLGESSNGRDVSCPTALAFEVRDEHVEAVISELRLSHHRIDDLLGVLQC